MKSSFGQTAQAILAALSLAGPLAAGTAHAAVLLPDASVSGQGKHIVINIPQLRLFVYNDGDLVKSYPIAVGKSRTQTPVGEFDLSAKSYNPTWHIPASIQQERKDGVKSVPPGPRNPLGPVFMRVGPAGLSIGIHGTNNPASVPGIRSHGCIRMKSASAMELSKYIDMRSPVSIIYQPFSLNLDENNDLWFASYGDPYGKSRSETESLEQSVQNFMAANGLEYDSARTDKILRSKRHSIVCLTCSGKSPSGKLTSLAWTQGLGEIRTPGDYATPYDFDNGYEGYEAQENLAGAASLPLAGEGIKLNDGYRSNGVIPGNLGSLSDGAPVENRSLGSMGYSSANSASSAQRDNSSAAASSTAGEAGETGAPLPASHAPKNEGEQIELGPDSVLL